VTPFSDGCGVVEAVGAGVARVAPGDRVATLFFQGWISGRASPQTAATSLGFPLPGAGAELQVFSEQGVSRVPEFLTDAEVATLPCAALTAWRALFEDARLQPGDTVVLQGTGGVSMFGLQFARAAGYRTLITSSSETKLERARALGADHLVDYRATPAWSEPVRAATGGGGADFILEVGGSGTIHESLRAIRMGGHIAIVGAVAGAGEPLHPAVLIGISARLQGVYVGSRAMFEAMCRALVQHRIRPVVDSVFPWIEARAAFEAMAAGRHVGKIVLTF
jgi:NADPH:quinone reductase-like Zn-dependent oxidoreductase